jgi:hypothetical protein
MRTIEKGDLVRIDHRYIHEDCGSLYNKTKDSIDQIKTGTIGLFLGHHIVPGEAMFGKVLIDEDVYHVDYFKVGFFEDEI